MWPHCDFCSHTCEERYKDFLEKGVRMAFIPTDDKHPKGVIQRFYRDNEKWYADVKGHTMEENEMVFGADEMLEFIAKDDSEVTLMMTDKRLNPMTPAPYELYVKEHDDDGAFYTIHPEDSSLEVPVKELWICNVTHDVFGEHPNAIYVYPIKMDADGTQHIVSRY